MKARSHKFPEYVISVISMTFYACFCPQHTLHTHSTMARGAAEALYLVVLLMKLTFWNVHHRS